MKPDWRTPAAQELASEWVDMQVPGNWEARGLPDFDGVVWFTRTFDWSGAAAPNDLVAWSASQHRRSLGERPVGDAGAVCAARGGSAPAARPRRGGAAPAPAGGGRGNASADVSPLPAGLLRAGKNTITVRIHNQRNEGGFLGTPE